LELSLVCPYRHHDRHDCNVHLGVFFLVLRALF
jgi:hypothetical protein